MAIESLPVAYWVLCGVIVFGVLALLSGIRVIPNDRVGLIEKRFSMRGSLERGIIALQGEAGFMPELLRGGVHYLLPFQYRVVKMALVTIPQGKIGYVFARDGAALRPAQTLAAEVPGCDFQDARMFLTHGGQRGPQRQILREGTYAINLAAFVVLTEGAVLFHSLDNHESATFRKMAEVLHNRGGFEPLVIKGSDDLVGVVTVHDGPSLPQGEIIAPVVGDDPRVPTHYHNNFQDPEAFLRAGGHRGRQLQVLVEGTYYLNRLFATIEPIAKTVVDVGHVGVVVSYTGARGKDVSGDAYKHGELVQTGERGVSTEALLPGKYAFNTYAGKVILVPTTNFILKWTRGVTGSHKLDENLSEVSLITKDAFEPSLPLSVVVHIDYRKAPLVIQRFGDVKRLVEQTLDPMVAAYFKNVGQTRTLIQLIHDRSAIQEQATLEMRERFRHYNLELEEVLIGTPTSTGDDQAIEQVLTQLRARQIAEEQVETYARQERAAGKERELREAEARAQQQAKLTQSELLIQIEANQGKAAYQRSVQEAGRIRALAEAEAEKAARIGIAEAVGIEEQVRAYGGPRFQVTREVMNRFASAIAEAKVDIVPKVLMGGTSQGGSSALESLLMLMLSERFDEPSRVSPSEGTRESTRRPEVDAMRDDLRRAIAAPLAAPSATMGATMGATHPVSSLRASPTSAYTAGPATNAGAAAPSGPTSTRT